MNATVVEFGVVHGSFEHLDGLEGLHVGSHIDPIRRVARFERQPTKVLGLLAKGRSGLLVLVHLDAMEVDRFLLTQRVLHDLVEDVGLELLALVQIVVLD